MRWTWQRNMTHRFQYREKRIRFFADGVAALCIRTRLSESRVLDQWYGVLFLFTELDDERLMRLRLERLMCWRESPERWSCYQHMLPVLILATSSRQAEHWQHAITTSAMKLRLDPMSGSIACVSQQDCAYMNPWRLAWRSLSTNHLCHLADSLRAVPREVFSSFLDIEKGEEEMQQAGAPPNASGASRSSERLTHLVVGNLVHRAATLTSRDLEEREVIALLGLRLTSGHWSIMRLLLAHPLFSDEDLAGLLGTERKSIRSSLSMLHTLGWLESISTSVGKRWHLSERGLLLVAAANHLHLRNFAVASKAEAEEASHMQLPGEVWLLQHIQHTAGVYGFFASLAQAAKQQLGQELCWWETSAICERRYQLREQWYNLRPDAQASYRLGSKRIHFWLEWDRGTMNARDLATKFISYAHYIDSREWAREWATLPLLVCIAPDIAQERRIQRVTQTKLARIPGLKVCTTTEGMLKEYGPLAPIWIIGMMTGSVAVSRSSPSRKLVFHMHSEKEVT